MAEPEWKQAGFAIRGHFQEYVEALAAKHGIARQPGEGCFCPDEFVVKYGRPFKPMPKPKGIKRRKIQRCYENSSEVALADPFKLVYVEGYAILKGAPIPMEHAWCSNRKGEVIDTTWTDGMGLAYWGVPIGLAYVKARVFASGRYGFLAGDLLEWPILSASPDVWRVPAAFFVSPNAVSEPATTSPRSQESRSPCPAPSSRSESRRTP